jgi:hypothetical protein
MEIESLLLDLCGIILLYFVPYVVVRLIHRRSFSLKTAKIMTIVWAIISAAIVVAIKFITSSLGATVSNGLNVAAIFIWHGFGYSVLLKKSKREKANQNSTPTAEPQTLINGEPWRDPETKAETYNPAPESSVAADPYNVDDVEVNIVKPKYATTHTTDRKTKIAFICMAIAIVLAVISAGVAISKNAECNQLKSEKVDIQRSLKSVNEQYDELLAHYNTVAEENEQAFINNNEYVLELSFYQRYAVCTNGGKYYHKYSCPRFDENKTFWIYNTEAAESDGLRPCPECIG